jgi:WD40 repeat protein
VVPTIRLSNFGTRKLLRTLIGHEGVVYSVAFASNNILASGSHDKYIRLWDTKTGYLLRTLESHGNSVDQVAFDYNNLLASGSEDKTIKLWDA